MATLASILGTTHEFVYINGPLECERARGEHTNILNIYRLGDGEVYSLDRTPRVVLSLVFVLRVQLANLLFELKDVPAFVKGPFYSWYAGLSSKDVKDAQDIVYDVIQDDGPFDGIIGFSQSASLIMSMLLHRQIHEPHKPPPFRFAIFFCCVVVPSPDQNFNAKLIAKYSKYFKTRDPEDLDDDDDETKYVQTNGDHHKETDETVTIVETDKNGHISVPKPDKKNISRPVKAAPKHRGMLLLQSQRVALGQEMIDLVKGLASQSSTPDKHDYKWREKKLDEFPRIFHPLLLRERVTIPTVHVLGKQDPL